MKIMNRPACLLGVLVLSVLACTKACGDSDEADDPCEPTYFSDSDGVGPVNHPTPLEVMEAKCTWPCDAPGCIKARVEKACQVRCESDADCPAQSICVCEAEGCSLGKKNLVSGWENTAKNSCTQLLPGMETYRRRKECAKSGWPRP